MRVYIRARAYIVKIYLRNNGNTKIKLVIDNVKNNEIMKGTQAASRFLRGY